MNQRFSMDVTPVIEAAGPSHEEIGAPRLDGVIFCVDCVCLLVIMHHIHLRFVINHYDVDGVLPKSPQSGSVLVGLLVRHHVLRDLGLLITSLSVGRWGSLGEIHIGSFYECASADPALLLWHCSF